MATGLHSPSDVGGHAIDLGAIAGLIDHIVHAWRPSRIWLFGSRARGEAMASSDWDLLVVAPDDATDADDPLAGWRLRKESGVPCDVLLCRAADFNDARDIPNTVAYEAAHHGVLVYGR